MDHRESWRIRIALPDGMSSFIFSTFSMLSIGGIGIAEPPHPMPAAERTSGRLNGLPGGGTDFWAAERTSGRRRKCAEFAESELGVGSGVEFGVGCSALDLAECYFIYLDKDADNNNTVCIRTRMEDDSMIFRYLKRLFSSNQTRWQQKQSV